VFKGVDVSAVCTFDYCLGGYDGRDRHGLVVIDVVLECRVWGLLCTLLVIIP
jgi:hypothetical protein